MNIIIRKGKFVKWFYLAAVTLSAFSCRTISPVAPPEVFQTVKVQPELSEITIPVEIPLRSLEQSINRSFSGLLYEDNNLEDDNLAVKVWKIDSVKISATGNVLAYRIPLKIRFRSRLKLDAFNLDLGELKEIEFAMNVKFKTRVNIDNNWKVETHSQFDGIDWIQRPEYNLGGIAIPIAPLAEKIIKDELSGFGKVIDDQAKKYLEIKPEISKAWETVQSPFKISDDPESWLKIAPAAVSVTPIKGDKDNVSVVIGLKAYTETVLGSKPQVAVTKLPTLQFGTDQRNSSPSPLP